MIKQIFTSKNIRHHLDYPLYMGFLFTLLSFVICYLLFKNHPVLVGITTIFYTILLATPVVSRLLDQEEELESESHKSFLQRHKIIFDFFIYFFIGMLVAFFLLSMLFPNHIYSENSLYLSDTSSIISSEGLPPPPTKTNYITIFMNNIQVSILCFILAALYGSGALLLLALNASIFSSSLSNKLLSLSTATTITSSFSAVSAHIVVMFLHTIPEMVGYILAAIAGGILSKAFIKEKLFSKNFAKVLFNAILLGGLAGVLLLIAAVIEAKITQPLLFGTPNLKNIIVGLIISAAVLGIIVILEHLRKKHSKHYLLKNIHKKIRRNH